MPIVTGGCVGPRADLDGGEKAPPHRNSIPEATSSQRIAVPTMLSWSTVFRLLHKMLKGECTEYELDETVSVIRGDRNELKTVTGKCEQ